MRFTLLITAAAMALLTVPVSAETVTRNTVVRGDRTVVTSRDESGRTRTRIIVQKRSFLDPGTQVFPGENRYNSGPALVWQPPFNTDSPERNTAFDRGRPPLPGQFDLPFPDNPVARPQ